MAEWYAAHSADGALNRHRRYGITAEQYATMHDTQGGVCAICGQPRELVVDHCHKTLAIRGLLCANCNKGLGMFADDPFILLAAWRYLLGAT